MSTMHISAAGLDLVKHFESCLKKQPDGRFKAYVDPVGVLTIGWGHTLHHGKRFDKSTCWTQQECDAELASDMALFEKQVGELVTMPLKQYQFDALVSFTYNVGAGNLKKSTLLRKLNVGDYAGAAHEFSKWNKGGGKVLRGLTRRRAAEASLFKGHPGQFH